MTTSWFPRARAGWSNVSVMLPGTVGTVLLAAGDVADQRVVRAGRAGAADARGDEQREHCQSPPPGAADPQRVHEWPGPVRRRPSSSPAAVSSATTRAAPASQRAAASRVVPASTGPDAADAAVPGLVAAGEVADGEVAGASSDPDRRGDGERRRGMLRLRLTCLGRLGPPDHRAVGVRLVHREHHLSGSGQRSGADRELLVLRRCAAPPPGRRSRSPRAAPSVSVVPETETGLGSVASVTTAFQPGTGRVETELSGAFCGRVRTILVVEAVGDSFGTRKVSWA